MGLWRETSAEGNAWGKKDLLLEMIQSTMELIQVILINSRVRVDAVAVVPGKPHRTRCEIKMAPGR